MLIDKHATLQCLGCIMKKPSLLEEYTLTQYDFEEEQFYAILFSCVYNLYNQGVEIIDTFAIDSFLSRYEKQYKIFNDNQGIDYCDDAIRLAELENFSYYLERLKKFSLLRYWDSCGVDIRNIYDQTIIDPSRQEQQAAKLDATSINDMILEEEDLLITKAKMLYGMDSSRRGQLAGKGMKELKERLKEEPEFGIPLQSPMMTTIARGARLKKVYLRSADSGGGKTRTALADICNISIPYFYDTDKKEWIYTGCEEPSLFISTELEEDEVQTIIMAYVSGVPENKILDGDYEGDEEERVDKAIEYIATYPLYIEIINDFGIEDISNIIKTYKREKGCHYFVFDYIHMSAKLIAEVASMSKGMKLREDQTLFLFMDTLKNLAMKLDIFILTMTQLNGTYKDSQIKDETMLRGAKSLADRIDLGEITLRPTSAELECVKKLMHNMYGVPIPNLVRHIYKVRRGKLTKIRLWQYADLSTGRTKDLFITDNYYNLIETEVAVAQIEKVIEEHSESLDDIQITDDEQQEATSTLLGSMPFDF